jgi:hypothetical protein
MNTASVAIAFWIVAIAFWIVAIVSSPAAWSVTTIAFI